MKNNGEEVFHMTTTAQKWGDSIGIRIPEKIAQKYGIVSGTKIKFIEDGKQIILKPVESEYTLEELLAQCKGENPHPEYFATPIGKEEI